MHIVHVTHRAWPVVGGSERHVQEIARRQALDGHQVTILATDADSLDALWDRRGRRLSSETPAEYQGVLVRRLSVQHLPLGALTFPALRRVVWLFSLLSARLALPLAAFSPWVPDLRQALARARADLLFAWNITLEGLTAAVAREARERHVPWIAVPLLHLARPRFYTMSHQVALLRQASAVLTQTAFDHAFLLKRGFAPRRVCTAGPGIDPAEGAQADGQRFRQKLGTQAALVVTLGSLGYDKGTLHLISAMHKLWDQGHGAHLALLGSQEASVRRVLARLPESQQAFCHCLGQVAESDKWDALDAADIVALPSWTESFGIVFLEAWMRGKPVIGARAGGITDVIQDGVNGRLVRFGDPVTLAETLASLLEQPEQARVMGQRGRDQTLDNYTWDQQYRRVRAVMEQVLAEWRS